MKITIIGTGYVGLVTGTCFAEKGNTVTCVDIEERKITQLQLGISPIFEPGLEELIKKNNANKKLHFTTQLEAAVLDSEVIFLALPTPPNEDGSADLSHVLNVALQLGNIIKSYKVIVNKSTVPVGTGNKVHNFIAQNAVCEFDVVSNPEFLREGMAVQEFMHPDRVVLGTSSPKAEKIMRELYAPFLEKPDENIVVMDIKSSEMTKYAANAFLATRLSFINEIANVCELTGANIENVKKGIGLDHRIGKHFLNAGVGYGGSCFPKDVKALINTATEYNYDFKILKTVDKVNKHQRLVLYDKIMKYYDTSIENKIFAVWGLAFKPDTDDVREAPAKYILQKLIREGAKIVAYDPEAITNFKLFALDNITYRSDAYECLPDADALLIITEWNEFKNADLALVKATIKNPVVFDGRNVWKVEEAVQHGFEYFSIGR